MSTADANALGTAAYESLGLVMNPFKDLRNREGETIGQTLEMQSEGNRLLVRLNEMANAERGHTLWVEKSDQVNNYYHRGALVHAEEVLIRDDSFSVLPAYIQLFAAKIGRVRSVMNVVGERLATRSFDVTLAAWVKEIVAEPDTELPQFEAIDHEKWEAFVEAVTEDSVQAVNDHFGEFVLFRKIEVQPPADVRLASLDEEPDETDESPEDDAMTAQIPDYNGIDPALIDVEDEADAGPDVIVEYIIAHTKAHLSPVIARGLRQYYERGFGPLSEELKITRAPKKTLKALVRMASLRFRKVVLMFDGFDNWVFMPEDLRIKYVTALTEMRMSLGSDATFVFFISSNQAPELDEHFGGGDRMTWDFPYLTAVGESADALNAEVIDAWLAAATLDGVSPMTVESGPLAKLVDKAEGGMTTFCAMAAAAIDDAAGRRVSALDDEALSAGESVSTQTPQS